MHGILKNKKVREIFEEINKGKNCKKCSKQWNGNKGRSSNLIPGFSSKKISIPIEVLIVSKEHGGTDDRWYEGQNTLPEEIEKIRNYYLEEKLKKYNQEQIRKLCFQLDQEGITWVFTDLIKCFVEHDEEKDKTIVAVKNCKKYLNKQIEVLKPKIIIVLGRFVLENYFNEHKKLKRLIFEEKIKLINREDRPLNYKIIPSYFPTGQHADNWVRSGKSERIVKIILEELKRNESNTRRIFKKIFGVLPNR